MRTPGIGLRVRPMATERLTAARVRTAQVRDNKRLEIRDDVVKGLEFRITERGQKSWYFQYTRKSDRRRRRVMLGTYPALELAPARKRAIELRAAVENGADPAAERKARQSAMTFRELAEERLEVDTSITDATKQQYKQALLADVFNAIGHVPASEVTADMVARVLDDVEGRGAAVHADRVRSAIGSTFKWAIKRRRAEVSMDPTAGLGKRGPTVPRTRVLSDLELATFWHAIGAESSPLTPSMQLIVKLAVLTGQRRSEVCGARTSELDLEGAAPSWTIPGDRRQAGKIIRGRMKNRQPQVVPLSRQAIELWRQAVELAEGHVCVFPSRPVQSPRMGPTQFPHIRPDSVSQAMRRLRAIAGIEDIRLHDMRRCIATWCGDQGIRPDVIDRILSHRPRDVTGRHYNFAGMAPLLREALQAWDDHVAGIVGLAAPADISG